MRWLGENKSASKNEIPLHAAQQTMMEAVRATTKVLSGEAVVMESGTCANTEKRSDRCCGTQGFGCSRDVIDLCVRAFGTPRIVAGYHSTRLGEEMTSR